MKQIGIEAKTQLADTPTSVINGNLSSEALAVTDIIDFDCYAFFRCCQNIFQQYCWSGSSEADWTALEEMCLSEKESNVTGM